MLQTSALDLDIQDLSHPRPNTLVPYVTLHGFVRIGKVLELYPIGKSTWWAGVQAGEFPSSVKLGPNTTAWHALELRKLIQTLHPEAPASNSLGLPCITVPLYGSLRLSQILELFPVGASTWWAKVKTGEFPPAMKLGPNITVWKVRDIHNLINTLTGHQSA